MGVIALWDVLWLILICMFDGVIDGLDFEILFENESLNLDVVVLLWFICNICSGSFVITFSLSSAFNVEAYVSDLGIVDVVLDEWRNLGVEIIWLLMDEWVEKFMLLKFLWLMKRAFVESFSSECAVSFAYFIDDSGCVCVKICEDFLGIFIECELFFKWFVDYVLN